MCCGFDQLQQGMILFGTGRGEAYKTRHINSCSLQDDFEGFRNVYLEKLEDHNLGKKQSIRAGENSSGKRVLNPTRLTDIIRYSKILQETLEV